MRSKPPTYARGFFDGVIIGIIIVGFMVLLYITELHR